MSDEWAHHASLPGMLQRGRGRGLREAGADAEGAGLVVWCLDEDWRWDEFDERGWYFARLMTALRIPVDAVSCGPADEDFLRSVWCETLLALASAGSAAAVDVLHAYVREVGDDVLVGEAVELIWDGAGAAGRVGLREVAFARMDAEALAAAVVPWEGGPWIAWRDEPAVAAGLDAWSPRRRPPAPDLSGLDSAALVEAAREWPHGRERRAAFAELGRRGDPVLLEIAEDPRHRTSHGVVPGLDRAVVELGPAALGRGRGWAGATDEYLRWIAGKVLARLGEVSDGPALAALFDEAAREGDWTATERLAAGLGRVGEPRAVPLLLRAWRETPHSHARAAYLRALTALRADELPALCAEAIDDCENEVRALVP